VDTTLHLNSTHRNLLITTAPGGPTQATVSGAMPVSAWAVVNGMVGGPNRVWEAQLAANLTFSQLFVNGQRRQRARLPQIASGGLGRGWITDVYRYAGPLAPCTPTCPEVDLRGFVYGGDDLNASWSNLQDVDLLTFHAWDASWHQVAAILPENRTVLFQPNSYSYLIGSQPTQGGRRYIVENVLEGLDEPGEFYYNRHTGQLFYIPLPGESLGGTVAWVPVVTTLFWLDQGAGNVSLASLQLQHTATGAARFSPYQGVGLVHIAEAEGVVVRQCSVLLAGGIGVAIDSGARGVEIADCTVVSVGYDGISMRSGNISGVHIHHNRVNDTGMIGLFQPAGTG
jgi:hypothetical protein